ncbi:MAG: hypothetical protein RL885_01185 [Planctomycetota bacterium]
MIQPELAKVLRAEFRLDWLGIHGAGHWARVRQNGLRLADHTGADVEVVELFAFLHDVQREDDGTDLEHGLRAARYAESLRGTHIHLDDHRFRLLRLACEGHSRGETRADPTVQTCWDADRLDLGRIGVMPHPKYLCTDVAKDLAVIEWAYARSQAGWSRA